MLVKRVALLISLVLGGILAAAARTEAEDSPVFVIGQDVQSIMDYQEALKDYAAIKEIHDPDGIMVYTAINDLRGLAEPVDHGAGVNHADALIQKYPQIKVVQIGLYLKFMLNEIVAGGLDENIVQLGEWIKNSGKRVYLRIGYEFDNPENGYDRPQYIQAYRHIVEHLRKRNVQNVYFVWHTIAWRKNDWPAYDPIQWYPGDQYVDWLGISFFDSARNEERDAAAELARKIQKPLMIAESSPFNCLTVEEKIKWMQELFGYMKNNHVKFLSYINVHWDALPLFAEEKWGDARLETSPVLMLAWLTELENYRK